MAKKITKAQIARAKQKPTTGDGHTYTQKPKLSETNLQGSKDGFIARLIRRSTQGGRH